MSSRITAGIGDPPKPGTLGMIDMVLENGTLIVKLDDGRRAQLASWEVEPADET